MFKLLFSIILALNLYAIDTKGDYLEAKDAFKVSQSILKDKINLNIKLAKDIYLYDNVKVIVNNTQDITTKLDIPKTTKYHDFDVYFDNLSINIPFAILDQVVSSDNIKLTLKYQGCSKAGLCYPPISFNSTLKLNNQTAQSNSIFSKFFNAIKDGNQNKVLELLQSVIKDHGYLAMLLVFFLVGLFLAHTPCIFPLVPILSSILVSNSKDMGAKKGLKVSLIYVFGMAIAYSIVGFIAGFSGFSLQSSLQNPWVLSFFSLIFVALALSLFGLYEIQLPTKLQSMLNKESDDAKKRGGFTGIFTMGFLSALIVGACTGPVIAGAFLLISFLNSPLYGALAFFMMGFGIGIPLLLLGLGAGKFMPKPGTWMRLISRFFGIILLAIAIVMISRIIPPVITMILWGLLSIGTGYFMGLFKKKRAKLLRIIDFIFVLYGAIILYGAYIGSISPLNPLTVIQKTNKWTYINSLEDLNTQLNLSDKYIMVDFTANWCVYCKDLENTTFVNPKIKKLLNNFDLLKVDITEITPKSEEILNKFQIQGPPHILFYNKNDKELQDLEVSGYMGAGDFEQRLQKVLKR